MITKDTPIDSPKLEAEARKQLKEKHPELTEQDIEIMWGGTAQSILDKLRGEDSATV